MSPTGQDFEWKLARSQKPTKQRRVAAAIDYMPDPVMRWVALAGAPRRPVGARAHQRGNAENHRGEDDADDWNRHFRNCKRCRARPLRRWLRFASLRNKSCIAIALAALMVTTSAVTTASSNAKRPWRQSVARLPWQLRRARPDLDDQQRVLASAGASSLEIVSNARPPATWPKATTRTGAMTTAIPAASPEFCRIRAAGGSG